MKSSVPKSHLFLPEDLHLWELPQVFVASSTWFERGMQNQVATFDLLVRDMPPHRNFLLFGGLEEIVLAIKNWKYSESEIRFLLKNNLISPRFAKYLKNFRFRGDIYAMKEGTPFFAGEPVLWITGPLPDVNLFSMFLLNALTGNTKFLSKVVRCVMASEPKTCIGVAGLRAEGFESAMKCARASYLAGSVFATSVPQFARKFNSDYTYGLTVVYHAVIKSFPSEFEAMQTMAKQFDGKVSLMIDTYEIDTGLQNAIHVAQNLKKNGLKLGGIMIDSGDLYALTKKVREKLDSAGFPEVKITIASNLDEYKISELNRKNIPVDAFLIATEAVAVPDAPRIEVVYKLAELQNGKQGKYCAKFSPGKESYPGKKQVFRVFENGIMKEDVIGLEKENLGTPLLVEVVRNGKIVYNLPNLDQIREYVKKQVGLLPPQLREIEKEHPYRVSISPELQELFENVKKENH